MIKRKLNTDYIAGLLLGLGSGFIGFGIQLSDSIVIGFGLICFFGSYLLPIRPMVRNEND